MACCIVQVKWGKQKFNDVELDTSEPPLLFKAQLFALTGVQPERQKVMFKAKTLGDDSWTDFPPIKDGAQIMLMGSADAVPQAPADKPVFMEDLTEGQRNKALQLTTGMKNLGNTCYMNSTLQCLKSIPELREALTSFKGSVASYSMTSPDGASALTAALRDMYGMMDRTNENEVIPILMLQMLHMTFPRFAEKDEHGNMMQQDANECWVEIVRVLQQRLKFPGSSDVSTPSGAESTASMNDKQSLISSIMGGEFEVTMKCKESEDEPEQKSKEEFLQLSCFLLTEVKYMHSGLRARLNEEITKLSPSLNRDAIYERKSLISRLPSYLCIQFVRFQYKEKSKTNAKILKDVKFPVSLDAYDLCTPELQQKLVPMRNKFKEADDLAIEEGKLAKSKGKEPLLTAASLMEDESTKKYLPVSFDDDPGSNNSGLYELQAVLTHKGRSSDSGHYVAWVRRSKSSRDWIMCDDDVITPIAEEEVLKLSGGGDWHSAYVLLYGSRMLEEGKLPKSSPGAVANGETTGESSMETDSSDTAAKHTKESDSSATGGSHS